ncbi:cysteine proteinase [Choiromyces venosus 120613-1]|uniref:Cysteine proteinase n=1 Tax=Choiromyces venosus 120613-1 TaxID=1336337 RepID=A0A3N4K8V6_9PEZI|nr:cysteine proteinase [Choiromyces venosus 120613-1]
MESAAITSDNPTTTPESSAGPATPVAISSPATSPSSSTSSQKRKREEDDERSHPSTTTPPRAREASVVFGVPNMWGFGYIGSIWKTIVDWSSVRRPEGAIEAVRNTETTEAAQTAETTEPDYTLHVRPESKRPKLTEAENSSRFSSDEALSIPNAIHSRASGKEYGRSQGDVVRDGLKLKAPAPNTSESAVTTQQLPSPQASASGDERFPNPPRGLALKTFSDSGKVRANCPLSKREEPFFAVPIRKPLQIKSVLQAALDRRDQKYTTRLAQAGFPSPGASLTPKFPGHMANKLGWSHNVSWKAHLSPRAQSILQTPLIDRRSPNELRRSNRLGSIDRPLNSGRVRKPKPGDGKEKKRKQEAIRRSQMRAHIESEPLHVLLEQLRARGEHGFLNLQEVEQKRKEREIEIQKLRAEDARNKIKKEVIPVLDPARKEKAEKTFAEVSRPGLNKTYITKWNIPITNRDFERLRPNQWLNDEIINFYMNLICERANSLFPNGPKKIFAHNTYFWPKLKSGGHKAVARWARRAKCGGEDLLKLDYLLMPVHVGGNHWCLAMVNFKQRRFEYYDSLGGKFTPESRPAPYKMMREYMRDETGGKFNDTDWVDYAMPGAPQQKNMNDCGVFTLKSAEVLTRNGRLDFTANDIPLVRSRMLVEILEGQLLPPGNP